MKTTFNLKDTDGNLLDLTERVLALGGTLNNSSIVDIIAEPTGKDFAGGYHTGYMYKKAKRSTTEVAGSVGVGNAKVVGGYTTQWLGKVFIDKKIREDNIIASVYDYKLLQEGKNGGMIVKEIADALLTNKELDVKFLYSELSTKANAMKIYTSVVKGNAGDSVAIKPSGAQAAQATQDKAGALAAVKAGTRSVILPTWRSTPIAGGGHTTDLTEVVREMEIYLTKIGADNSIETFYPWSINGLPPSELVIVTTFEGALNLKDSITYNVINISDPKTSRNINGLVAFIDTIPVYISNQIGKDVVLRIHSKRAFVRDIDKTLDYMGVIKTQAGSVVMKDGTQKNVGADEILIQMESGRRLGAVYFEEAFEVKEK